MSRLAATFSPYLQEMVHPSLFTPLFGLVSLGPLFGSQPFSHGCLGIDCLGHCEAVAKGPALRIEGQEKQRQWWFPNLAEMQTEQDYWLNRQGTPWVFSINGRRRGLSIRVFLLCEI